MDGTSEAGKLVASIAMVSEVLELLARSVCVAFAAGRPPPTVTYVCYAGRELGGEVGSPISCDDE